MSDQIKSYEDLQFWLEGLGVKGIDCQAWLEQENGEYYAEIMAHKEGDLVGPVYYQRDTEEAMRRDLKEAGIPISKDSASEEPILTPPELAAKKAAEAGRLDAIRADAFLVKLGELGHEDTSAYAAMMQYAGGLGRASV